MRKCATLVGIHNYCGRDLEESVKFLERTQYKSQLRLICSGKEEEDDEYDEDVDSGDDDGDVASEILKFVDITQLIRRRMGINDEIL